VRHGVKGGCPGLDELGKRVFRHKIDDGRGVACSSAPREEDAGPERMVSVKVAE
jgi:hypothetical protein